MALDQLWNLVKKESLEIHRPQSALDRPCTVRDDPHHFLHEHMVRGYFAIPAVHQLLDHDRNDSIELYINVIAACQRG